MPAAPCGRMSIPSYHLLHLSTPSPSLPSPVPFLSLPCSAERGLSNYLIFERSKTDPKLAAAAAEVEPFEDDADGNLVRVVDSSRRTVVKNPYTRPTPEEEAAAEAAVGAGGGARRRKAAASSSSSSGAGAGSGAGGAGAAPKKSSGKVAAGGAGSAGSKAGSVSGLDQGSGAQPMR